MNYKLVIINTLLLLYWEQQIETGMDNSSLIKNIIKELKVPKDQNDSERNGDVYTALQILVAKHTMNYGDKIIKNYLIQQVRLICVDEPNTGDIILDGLNRDLDQTGIREYCLTLMRELKDYQRKSEFQKILNERAGAILYSGDDYDLTTKTRELISLFEQFAAAEGEDLRSIRGVTEFIDFEDEGALREMFLSVQKSVSPDEIIRFGIQALNRLFGEQLGARRKEMVMVSGLQHHFKSGMTMTMVRGAAMHNKPKVKDPSKKPAIVMLSTENQLEINLRTLYKQCMEPILGKSIKVKDIDPSTAAAYMKEKFMENGWNFLMVQVDPDAFGFDELQGLVLKIEAMGYELILLATDYLGMCSTKGLTHSGITGRDKQALYNRSRNLMLRHDYIHITPHQLSTEALGIHRDRPKNFMNEVPNNAYYHDCKTLAQEVDVEVILQKLEQEGVTYLNVGRGKHRGVDNTKLEDQRFTLRFTEFGIVDDIDGPDSSMRKPGAGTAGNGGGLAWHHESDDYTPYVN